MMPFVRRRLHAVARSPRAISVLLVLAVSASFAIPAFAAPRCPKGEGCRSTKKTSSPSPSPSEEELSSPSPSPSEEESPSPSPSPSPSEEESPSPSPSPSPSESTSTSSGGPKWGLIGGYAGIDMKDIYGRGVRVVMMEMRWRTAEPSDGSFDLNYFSSKRTAIEAWRSLGFEVILNFGMHHAPSWLLEKPYARFINQHGHVYTNSNEANLVFATEYRSYAERYTAKVFSELGTNFLAVRVGGGHWGELNYPAIFNPDTGKIYNYYWAFDGAAARTNPVPGWTPGQSSPNNEASRFLTWYLDALTAFQNWQIQTVRKHYPGYIAVLYASWGMRSGDFDKAVSTNLSGTSSPEINGEVQRGYDHARHIAALSDAKAAVWGTWADKSGTISWLASLADAKGLAKFGENSGSDDVTKMDTAMKVAVDYKLTSLLWVRAEEAYCFCNGYATITDYETRIASSA